MHFSPCSNKTIRGTALASFHHSLDSDHATHIWSVLIHVGWLFSPATQHIPTHEVIFSIHHASTAFRYEYVEILCPVFESPEVVTLEVKKFIKEYKRNNGATLCGKYGRPRDVREPARE